MRRILFIVILSGISVYALSQAQYVSFRIDSAVREAMEARRIPGLQVAVIKYGLVLKKGHYGFANLEDRVRVTDSTLFSIAAMSNSLTCAGILLLMEDGKLSLDDLVGKYLDAVPARWSGITIRQLMNNTSGIRNLWEQGDDFFCLHNSDSSLLAALQALPLVYQPGGGFHTGSGCFVLGLVIAKVSGETFPDFMKHRIFDKLGMDHSRVNDPVAVIRNRAAGYQVKNNRVLHGRQIPAAAQSGGDMGLLTTVTDLLKWYAALQDSSLLRKSSLDSMFSPGRLPDSRETSYGMGWFLGPYRDHRLIFQTGDISTGFSSVMEMYPEDHVCIVILCNRQQAGMHLLAKEIIGLFNPDYGPASKVIRMPDPDTVQTLLMKSYFEELGLSVDTTRKMARELHMPFYPENDGDLAPFRNITNFTFIKAIRPPVPAPDIFGDTVRHIYLYEVTYKDLPARYYAFLLDPAGKLVYLDLEKED